MSGDIGAGATRAAVSLAANVAASKDRPPGTQYTPNDHAHVSSDAKLINLAVCLGLHSSDEKLDHCLSSGYLQLAGGTNAHTVKSLKREGLFQTPHDDDATIAGVAYGGYARKVDLTNALSLIYTPIAFLTR